MSTYYMISLVLRNCFILIFKCVSIIWKYDNNITFVRYRSNAVFKLKFSTRCGHALNGVSIKLFVLIIIVMFLALNKFFFLREKRRFIQMFRFLLN